MLDIIKSLPELMGVANLSPQAQQVAPSAGSPEGLLQVLGKEKLAPDSVNVLAHGMPEQKSVFWACKSSDMVSSQMTPQDMAAKMAAENWVKNPTPANQNAAADAAAKTDYQGPGAWAAQGAAWSNPTPVLPPEGLPADAFPAVKQPSTGDAVAGSVKLSAAMKNDPNVMSTLSAPAVPKPAAPMFQMPAIPDMKAPVVPTLAGPTPPPVSPMTPQELDASSKALDPFLKLGMDIAQNKISWV
jgi:hypothetical protein